MSFKISLTVSLSVLTQGVACLASILPLSVNTSTTATVQLVTAAQSMASQAVSDYVPGQASLCVSAGGISIVANKMDGVSSSSGVGGIQIEDSGGSTLSDNTAVYMTMNSSLLSKSTDCINFFSNLFDVSLQFLSRKTSPQSLCMVPTEPPGTTT